LLRGPAARVAAKMGGRFVAGANIAIAGADAAHFARTVNSKASLGKKVTSGINAAGSIAAATNPARDLPRRPRSEVSGAVGGRTGDERAWPAAVGGTGMARAPPGARAYGCAWPV
jgi:hypothetical protein